MNMIINHCTNQQLIGHRDMFRGGSVKEWVMGNNNSTNLHARGEALVKSSTQFCHECWKRRCVVFHDPEVQRKVLKEEALVIMEEAEKTQLRG